MLGFLVALNLLGAGGLWFGHTTMIDKKAEEADVKQQLADESDKTARLGTLKKTLALASVEHEKLLQYMYDQSDESQVNFISRMEQLGTSTTGALVETKSLTLTATEPKIFYGEFALTGKWSEVYHVLRLTEEFPANIVIKRFEVKSATGNSSAELDWTGLLVLDLISLKSGQ